MTAKGTTRVNRLTKDVIEAYLKNLETMPVKNVAARLAFGKDMHDTSYQYWQIIAKHFAKHPELREREREAVEIGYSRVEEKAITLALHGNREVTFSKDGKVVGEKTVYSDRLITFLLERGPLSNRFKNRSEVDVNARVENISAVDGLIVTPQDLLLLPKTQRKELLLLLQALSDAKSAQLAKEVPTNEPRRISHQDGDPR